MTGGLVSALLDGLITLAWLAGFTTLIVLLAAIGIVLCDRTPLRIDEDDRTDYERQQEYFDWLEANGLTG